MLNFLAWVLVIGIRALIIYTFIADIVQRMKHKDKHE